MATTTTEEQFVFSRQIIGAEDMIFGFGVETQIRDGENVNISHINSAHIPYDSTRSVKDVLDELLLSVQGS